MVVDSQAEPVLVINRFLKFKDNAGKARNTLRAYAYQLSLYFEYLEQKKLDYREAVLEDIAAYMRWLQKLERQDGIVEMRKSGRSLRNVTINTYASPFHGGNTGSIPVGVTDSDKEKQLGTLWKAGRNLKEESMSKWLISGRLRSGTSQA